MTRLLSVSFVIWTTLLVLPGSVWSSEKQPSDASNSDNAADGSPLPDVEPTFDDATASRLSDDTSGQSNESADIEPEHLQRLRDAETVRLNDKGNSAATAGAEALPKIESSRIQSGSVKDPRSALESKSTALSRRVSSRRTWNKTKQTQERTPSVAETVAASRPLPANRPTLDGATAGRLTDGTRDESGKIPDNPLRSSGYATAIRADDDGDSTRLTSVNVSAVIPPKVAVPNGEGDAQPFLTEPPESPAPLFVSERSLDPVNTSELEPSAPEDSVQHREERYRREPYGDRLKRLSARRSDAPEPGILPEDL